MAPRLPWTMVGLGGLEPPASPLSGVRSNHLSYRPMKDESQNPRHATWFRSTQLVSPVRSGCCEESGLDGRFCSSQHGCCVKQTLRVKYRCLVWTSCNKTLRPSFSKGGDPAAPSDTATLLRLHPSHEPLRGRRPPCG